MTRRDVVKLCIFTSQTTLRENTQPYRFWGLQIFTPLTLRFQDFQRWKCIPSLTGNASFGHGLYPHPTSMTIRLLSQIRYYRSGSLYISLGFLFSSQNHTRLKSRVRNISLITWLFTTGNGHTQN
ncbi:MAG: hypothetical protein ABL924_11880 [Methyloglobulus sp.]